MVGGCEDYSCSAQRDGFSYGIVADGCGSCKNAAIGASILSRSYANYLDTILADGLGVEDVDLSCDYALGGAIGIMKQLNLPVLSCASTLLSVVSDGSLIRFLMYGDGAYFYRRHGVWFGRIIRYSNNSPDYPIYRNMGEYQDLLGDDNGVREIIKYSESDFTMSEPSRTTVPFPQMSRLNDDHGYTIDAEGVDIALVCSDGLEDFVVEEDGKRRHLKLDESIEYLLQFPSIKGPFVERRLKFGFDKARIVGPEATVKKYTIEDDLGIAAIAFNV